MTRARYAGLVALVALAGVGRAQNPQIVHNTNSYPVWVATGYVGGGVMDLTGGGNHGLDELQSTGWVKIPPRDAHAFPTHPSLLHVRAYSLTAKTWFQVRPTGPGQPRKLFYKLDNFKEGFYAGGGLDAAVQKKGGELRDYYPLQAHLNPQTKRYELSGPTVQGGEPPLPLPAAVATAGFTNRTDSRVFFAVASGGKTTSDSLAAGLSARFPIQVGNPPASVVVTQNDGTKLAFNLPKGAEYEFRAADGKVKVFFK